MTDQFDELIIKRMENLSKRAEAIRARGKQLPPILKANTEQLSMIAENFGEMAEEIQVVIDDLVSLQTKLASYDASNFVIRKLRLQLNEVLLAHSQSLKQELENTQQKICQMCLALDRVSMLLEKRAKEEIPTTKLLSSPQDLPQIYEKINLRLGANEHQQVRHPSGDSEVE